MENSCGPPHGNYRRSLARYYLLAVTTASLVGVSAMRDDAWRHLDDEALERLLIERWLRRGVMLAVILLAAIAATWFGIRGVETVLDHVTVGVFVALALAAGALGFSMRQEDLRIQRELRRRRKAGN
jgi:hypothetical protein